MFTSPHLLVGSSRVIEFTIQPVNSVAEFSPSAAVSILVTAAVRKSTAAPSMVSMPASIHTASPDAGARARVAVDDVLELGESQPGYILVCATHDRESDGDAQLVLNDVASDAIQRTTHASHRCNSATLA